MTTATRNRCRHCQQTYIYHPSFYGGEEANHPYNDDRYCPDCYRVVKEALSKVPAKYEKRFVESGNYSKEQIIAHQEERCRNGIPVRRIFPTMFDLTGQSRHHIVCECMPDNEWYKVEWWSDKPQEASVSKETWCKI